MKYGGLIVILLGLSSMRLAAEKQADPVSVAEGMVLVQGGTFEMGDTLGDCITGHGGSGELPVHSVRLDSFSIAKTLVTFDDFDLFCNAEKRSKPDDEGWGRGIRPAIHVSWYDAIAYCNWLSGKAGFGVVYGIRGTSVDADWKANGFRLPTEAEWEFAARERGKSVRYGNGTNWARNEDKSFDNDPHDYMQARGGAGGVHGCKLLPVGIFPPNALGLLDMAGNVWQWCWDYYEKDYFSKSPQDNPKGGISKAGIRVLRGGSWDNLLPVIVRASFRNADAPEGSNDFIEGFRLCRSEK
jgi:formylglycine-generating enzyme required for sulfatase activity